MDDATKPLLDDQEFLTDFARLSEGIYDEKFLRTKYHFVDDATWERLGQDDELVEKIMLLRAARVRSGATKRELAQKHMVRAPDVLNNIMSNPEASYRHVVDAIKTMDALAGGNPEGAPASDERFQITIVLNADEKIRVSKATGLVPNDVEVLEHDTDSAPQSLLAIAAANKPRDGGDGEPI